MLTATELNWTLTEHTDMTPIQSFLLAVRKAAENTIYKNIELLPQRNLNKACKSEIKEQQQQQQQQHLKPHGSYWGFCRETKMKVKSAWRCAVFFYSVFLGSNQKLPNSDSLKKHRAGSAVYFTVLQIWWLDVYESCPSPLPYCVSNIQMIKPASFEFCHHWRPLFHFHFVPRLVFTCCYLCLVSPVEEQPERQPVFGSGAGHRQRSHHVPLSWHDATGQWTLILSTYVPLSLFSSSSDASSLITHRDLRRGCCQRIIALSCSLRGFKWGI